MATNNSVDVPLSGNTGTGNFVGSTSPTIATPSFTTNATFFGTAITAVPIDKVVIQTFTSSGTYTPTAGMVYCIMEAVGGGAAGGSCTSSSGFGGGGGGGAGSYSKKIVTAATVGASQTVTIGAAGTAGATGNHPGGNGVDTSIGAICIGKGGTGGGGTVSNAPAVGGVGGVAGTGDFIVLGGNGGCCLGGSLITAPFAAINTGGSSVFGPGALATTAAGTGNAAATGAYGAGGSGGLSSASSGDAAGGAGYKGVAVITEFLAS